LDLEICGEAQDAMEAVIKTKELNPDLVIMDINMPRAGGFAAAPIFGSPERRQGSSFSPRIPWQNCNGCAGWRDSKASFTR
jgi:PleD family two-component response regulator